MDNYQIADYFSLLSKLMDIHGENAFKSKSYASAAFSIEKLPPLSEIPFEKIASLKGIGSSAAQKIIEILQTGKLLSLEDIISKTPEGIFEMLQIKGIGPKKINTIWKEMEIETIGELLYACKENRLKLYKGFGEKTQQNVIDSIEFYFKNKGRHLYAQVEMIADGLLAFLNNIFPVNKIDITGSFKRQLEIIEELEFIIDTPPEIVELNMSSKEEFELTEKNEKYLQYSTPLGIDIKIHTTTPEEFMEESIVLSSSAEFNTAIKNLKDKKSFSAKTEEEYFISLGLPVIPAYYREHKHAIENIQLKKTNDCIDVKDIKGIIHSHSNWSDGSNTIEEMAIAAQSLGMEYLVISDHSKSAFYAQGLSEEKIMAQHQYIDELNTKLAPFKIFKSIESDILNDGNLDYADKILNQFDLIIASVHSNLKMNEEKAMSRLIKAIENPFTTIIGHMTGRLLLSRPGYPINHRTIIDACAANKVVIELNAHPSRLDIDWRHIEYALEKNVLISINPDAHTIDGLNDVKYGVLTAQKAMLPKKSNLSSFSLKEFTDYIQKTKSTKCNQ
jgi:DNA polymerase (family 10)